MNIFRSEEHVKNWSLYNPESEDAIMPLADWVEAGGHPRGTTVRTANQRIHEKALATYRERYG